MVYIPPPVRERLGRSIGEAAARSSGDGFSHFANEAIPRATLSLPEVLDRESPQAVDVSTQECASDFDALQGVPLAGLSEMQSYDPVGSVWAETRRHPEILNHRVIYSESPPIFSAMSAYTACSGASPGVSERIGIQRFEDGSEVYHDERLTMLPTSKSKIRRALDGAAEVFGDALKLLVATKGSTNSSGNVPGNELREFQLPPNAGPYVQTNALSPALVPATNSSEVLGYQISLYGKQRRSDGARDFTSIVVLPDRREDAIALHTRAADQLSNSRTPADAADAVRRFASGVGIPVFAR